MQLISTSKKAKPVSLKQAVLKGMPEDGGLYIPSEFPVFPNEFFREIRSLSFQEIAFRVAESLLGNEIKAGTLHTMVVDAMNFEPLLLQLDDQLHVLELFHGPTLSFKDFGARFMARLMSHFVSGSAKELFVLVATSGDTGSAVAQGFFRVPGIRVVLLYPSGQVSSIQEKQFTTLSENITALEIDGTFDDCQRMVKQAFADEILTSKLDLTSANSINIARLIPQTFYYFYAYSRLKGEEPPVISVPSGNFGNVTAGLVAKKMGLPVVSFVAAVNANDTFCRYLETGVFEPAPSKRTISNAMDVGNPSNLSRIFYLYDHDREAIQKDLCGFSFSDDETRDAMLRLFRKYRYVPDPHGAVGYLGLKSYFASHPGNAEGIFFETAHPAKFPDVVEPVIQGPVRVPARLQQSLEGKKHTVRLSSDFTEFKHFLAGTSG